MMKKISSGNIIWENNVLITSVISTIHLNYLFTSYIFSSFSFGYKTQINKKLKKFKKR